MLRTTRALDPTPSVTSPSPSASGNPGWDALWSMCLQAAHGGLEREVSRLGSGPGLQWCPRQGWQLQGTWSADAAERFLLYKPLLDRRPGHGEPARPWVIGQLAQSLDGFVAMASGESCYISGPDNLLHLHRLRALCDAVVVGAGTVAADDPQLTTRLVPGRHPVRVVIDPSLGLSPDRRLFRDAQALTLWLHDAASTAACESAATAASGATSGVERIAIPGLRATDGGVDMARALAALHHRGLQLVFVEGGGTTVSRFLAQGLLDRLHLAIAPLLIGRGRPGLQAPVQDHLADCLRPSGRAMAMGRDMLWDLDFRAVAGAGD